MTVFQGSQVLEDIRQYGPLICGLKDSQMSWNRGLAGDIIGSTEICATKNSDNSTASTLVQLANNITRPSVISSGGAVTYNHYLMSGVIGLGMNKYLNIGSLTGGDITLELTLASNATALVSRHATNLASYTITNVEFVTCILQIDPSVEASVQKATGGRQQISSSTYANFRASVASGAGNSSIDIPARYGSLEALYVIHRQTATVTDANAFSNSCRDRADLTEYYFTVGSMNIPQKPIEVFTTTTNTHGSEPFSELMKSFHSLGNIHHETNMTSANYMATDSTKAWNADTNTGRFLIGQELESYSNQGQIESGVDTKNSLVTFHGTYATAPADETVDVYAKYSLILNISNGIVIPVF